MQEVMLLHGGSVRGVMPDRSNSPGSYIPVNIKTGEQQGTPPKLSTATNRKSRQAVLATFQR